VSVRTWQERLAGRGLELCVHRFRDESAPVRAHALFLHGFLDAGATWDLVAAELAPKGIDVWAPDLRGFGRSDRVGAGGYYHFPDHVADVAALVRRMPPEPIVLVGHSMGGTVACMFAGARPDRIARLVLLEGVGPPAMGTEVTLLRMRTWLDQLEEPRDARPLADEDDAIRRLRKNHPRVPDEVLRSRLPHLWHRDGAELRWAHDPMHRTTAPMRFDVEAFKHFVAQIRCPVLFVSGGELGWHPPDEAERLAAFGSKPERAELAGAGHMMHWTRPAELGALVAGFALAGP
jgi:pimeloyl-ACP methyl ester carboxylesterase